MVMKLQIPGSKLQRNFKNQAPMDAGSLKYPEFCAEPWELRETSDGNTIQRHAFDLEERTARFGEALIRFCKKIPRSPENNRLIDQLIGCGTSVGANYCEANEGVSKKDFKNTIGRCVKEAKETKFFSEWSLPQNPHWPTRRVRSIGKLKNYT